jgi:hypothetical protein
VIGDLYDANDVKVGQAALFVAPATTALPANTKIKMTDPFALTPWQTGTGPYTWNPVGATSQGWSWDSTKKLQTINIEEQSTPVDKLIDTQTISISGALSEDIVGTLQKAYNMTAATTAATSDDPGFTTLTLTDTATHYAVALVMQNTLSFPRVLYIPKTTCLSNVKAAFRRAAAARMYTVEFTSICKTATIKVIEYTAVKT